uniref:Uncharacterized protein n=1 Tax=Odontella aurita TaxID=265563 RepID=A0A7S4K141_9STRA|mmetsp:Transcript_59111/g.175729  ORF Transcript_59111/g.175729 Transcript_59111/m.175729 type:complete len:119 (+) Transcript_59111:246-602(+)
MRCPSPPSRPTRSRARRGKDGSTVDDAVALDAVSRWIIQIADLKHLKEKRAHLVIIMDEEKRRHTLLDWYDAPDVVNHQYWAKTERSRTTMERILKDSGVNALKEDHLSRENIQDGPA